MNRATLRPVVLSRAATALAVLLVASTAVFLGCGKDAPPPASKAPTPRALELRNLGLAQLENEDPAAAEETYRKLAAEAPDDPLPLANLAIAALRQQKAEEALTAIEGSLALAPQRGDLLALKGDVLQWSGKPEEALAVYRAAAERQPRDPEVLYSLYRQASSMTLTPEAEAAMAFALERLAQLRPENVVVLLAQGKAAISTNDRAAATAAFLRVKELLWQAPEVAERAMEVVFTVLEDTVLEDGNLEAARTPAQRLENVLKVTPMYREGLRELMTGIQGIPVSRFENEPPATEFGPPGAITFKGALLDPAPTLGRGLTTGDFDGDGKADIARLVDASDGTPALELRLSSTPEPQSLRPAPGLSGLLPTDLDNNGLLDLLGYGAGGIVYWTGDGQGGLTEVTASFGLAEEALAQGATAAIAFDYDIEGDLDLVAAGTLGLDLLRNSLEGPLAAVGSKSFPEGLELTGVRDLLASDIDRDGDQDLVISHAAGLTLLDNLRQGRFQDRSREAGLQGAASAAAILSADLDNDGWPEIVTAGAGITVFYNRDGKLEGEAIAPGDFEDIEAFDGDNDGRLDLAAAGESGILLVHQQASTEDPMEDPMEDKGEPAPPPKRFSTTKLEGSSPAKALAAADLDGDGRVDLLAGGPGGLTRFTNLSNLSNLSGLSGGDSGSKGGHWLSIRLRGIDEGNSKNNILGLGATVEVFAGGAYQFREVLGDVTHFGLGSLATAPKVRVVWTNGVPQNRIDVAGNQQIVETQVLKGSCPFLYTWNGEEIAFVTDLLWGAPLGMPVAPGIWAGADPQELVKVEGAQPREGSYDLRITEELWEAAYFDHVKLWVVDHPQEVEVASSLKIVLGETIEEQVLGSRDVRPVPAAWDSIGRQVGQQLALRDDVYVAGYEKSPYQGIALRPWSLAFHLGEAPDGPIRLHLDGWIFPADASLNLAAAQRDDLSWDPPRLEVETPAGWEVLMPVMPFPAGKTKTMVVDTPPLPKGSQRLRIVTTQWLHWDRIAWTTRKADSEPQIVAKLAPVKAELRERGFSGSRRQAPNAPHGYDYGTVIKESPWLPFAGAYTRLGDVRELLETADDRSVILAAGDEIVLAFDASELAPPKAGWKRTVFLESHGWDKDADRNTFEANHLEPLPFRAMSGYPYGDGESFPDTPEMREYRDTWLTRVLKAPVGPEADPAPTP